MSRFERLIVEVHRRLVWQILAIYVVGAWIGLEVIQALAQNLGLPGWFPPLAIGLLILGLPIVLTTAYMQGGPPGLRRRDLSLRLDREAAAQFQRSEPEGMRRLFTWRNAIMGGVLLFALWVVVAAGWLLWAARFVREAGG